MKIMPNYLPDACLRLDCIFAYFFWDCPREKDAADDECVLTDGRFLESDKLSFLQNELEWCVFTLQSLLFFGSSLK